MSEGNETLVTELALTGLTERSWLQFLHFPHILGRLPHHYKAGSPGLMALVWEDAHLHMSTYLFLGGLAFVDACTSNSVTLRMPVNFLDMTAMISLAECITQIYFFAPSATIESFLLLAMAYGHYRPYVTPCFIQ